MKTGEQENGSVVLAQPAGPVNSRTRRQAIFDAIAMERFRQERLLRDGRFPYTCADPIIPHNSKLPVLMEEVGEVAKAICELSIVEDEDGTLADNLQTELIQTAAVCVAWLEAITADKEDAS